MKRAVCSVLMSLLIASPALALECADNPCAPKKKTGEWISSAALGFSLTNGNSDTLLVNLDAATELEKDGNIWNLNGTVRVGEQDDEATQRLYLGGASIKHLLSDSAYIGFGVNGSRDEIADIDYRAIANPTAGYFVLKNSDYRLNFEAGPSYTFEKVGGEKDDYLSPRIANRFEWQISCTSKFYQAAEVLFDVNDSENTLANGEIGIEAALSTQLALVLAVKNTYDNQPAAGRENNDIAVISAIKASL